jgi:hypothetical protein
MLREFGTGRRPRQALGKGPDTGTALRKIRATALPEEEWSADGEMSSPCFRASVVNLLQTASD